MKQLTRIIVVSLFITIACGIAHAEVVDRVIAIINDDIVTLKDFEAFIKIEKRTTKYTSIDEYFRNLQMKEKLETFIEGTLIKQQAKKTGIVVTDQEVSGYIESIKKQNLITDAELKEQLKKDNVTYEQFKEGIKLNLLRTRLLMRVVSLEVSITENALKSYYDSHQDYFKEEEFHLQQIFISGKHQDIRERAEKAYKQLVAGTSFTEVARKVSDDPSAPQGGDIGFVKRSDLLPTLRDALNGLTPGAFSVVVPTPYGLHILKLIEVKQAGIVPYDEVKKTIRERMMIEESSKRYQDYIAKIKRSSYIEVKI
jgi:peptidyl-prolyl cis-trans isomerase SurA